MPSASKDGEERTPPASSAVRVVLLLIRVYKILASPLFAGACRFTPSCSEYMADAVARYGVLRGGWLGLVRLSRCHPLGGHGFDPVPPPTAETRAAGSASRLWGRPCRWHFGPAGRIASGRAGSSNGASVGT